MKHRMPGSVGLILCDEDYVVILKCFTNYGFGLRRDNDHGRPSLTESRANITEHMNNCGLVINKCNWFWDRKTSFRCACAFSRSHDYGPDFVWLGRESQRVNQTRCMWRGDRSD